MVDHGEEVAGFEAAVEEGVEHVLGGEVEADGAVISGFEFREAGAEGGGGVGDILHDVGGEPDFADADFLVVGEDFEGALHGADAVVDAGENVAVPVGGAFEEAAVEDGVVFGEGPHSRMPFLGMQRYRLFRQSQREGATTQIFCTQACRGSRMIAWRQGRPRLPRIRRFLWTITTALLRSSTNSPQFVPFGDNSSPPKNPKSPKITGKHSPQKQNCV